jgi:Hint domain
MVSGAGAGKTQSTRPDATFGADWIGLSDHEMSSGTDILERGALVMEMSLPLGPAGVLLDHRTQAGWPRTFSIFHDLGAGLMILHRQGKSLARHVLPGPLPDGPGTARLTFGWDAPARRWDLTLEVLGTDDSMGVQGRNPLPLLAEDVASLCRGRDVQRHPAVLWFGVTRGGALPVPRPWIGLATPVPTPNGFTAAGDLRPGDRVATLDNGAVPVLAVHKMVIPSRGSFAPVLLRAPFFAARHDLLVAADQLVRISGPEVEYLFGDEEILLPASTLIDGQTALRDTRRAVAVGVSIGLGLAELVSADGCILSTERPAGTTLPRPLLEGYETVPLMALLARKGRRGLRA